MENNSESVRVCPVGIFTEKLGGKWKLEIIYHLRSRTLRFGQLAAIIDGISRKVLTDHLKQMENDGLICRKSYNETPPRVEYSLTPAAKDLEPLFEKLGAWVQKHYSF